MKAQAEGIFKAVNAAGICHNMRPGPTESET